MKIEQVSRSVFVNIIILIATMAISGCFPLPLVEYTGAKPASIKAGTTNRITIMDNFGLPYTKTSDGRFFLYDYSVAIGWCLIGYGVGECFPGEPSKGMVLIEFDTDNIVKQHVVHVCGKLPDPLCDPPKSDTMWALINRLVGEDVAAQNGQTLDEYRQTESLQNSQAKVLHGAAKFANILLVKRLITEGTDVHSKIRYGDTPLHTAASNGHVSVAELLLSSGAVVSPQNYFGQTPLYKAVMNGHVGITELLLTNGADVNARDLRGSTPLHEAAMRAHVAVIKLLLAKGASVNVREASGDMPLHKAIRGGNITVVRLLLTHGADANAKARGWFNRPVKIARDFGGREDIIELLKQHGGKE